MPTPSLVQSGTNHNWISSIDAVAATKLLKPEIYPEMVRKYGDQLLTGFLELNGTEEGISALNYLHWEDDWTHETVKVQTFGGGAANSTVTLTVQPTYVYTYSTSAQNPYIVVGSTGNNPPSTTNPLLNEQIVIIKGVQCLVTNVTSNTFDVTPTVAGTSVPSISTSDEIIIPGNAHPEQTGQPGSRNSRLNKYENNLMIQKWKHTTSGSAMGEMTWVPFENYMGSGQTGWMWYFEGQDKEHTRVLNEYETMFLVGQNITNTTLANLRPTTTITRGIIPDIEANGVRRQYSSLGITRNDFEVWIRQADAQRASKENTLWCGITLRQGIDQFVGNEMKNGAITYGVFGGDKQKTIDFGFDSFILTGYTFHMKTYDPFNYPKMLGAPGQPYKTMGLVVPVGNVVSSFGPQGGTKKSVPTMRLVYLQGKGNGYSRRMEQFLTGGVNGTYTNDLDQLDINWRTHSGIEMFAINRYGQFYI